MSIGFRHGREVMVRRTGFVAAAAFAVALAGCGGPGEPPTATVVRPINPDRASSKELREHVSLGGVQAGAEAGRQMLVVHTVQQPAAVPPVVIVPTAPQPPAPPAPTALINRGQMTVTVARPAAERKPEPARPAVVRFTLKSDKPDKTETAAIRRATEQARHELMRQLQLLDPPVVAYPSLTKMQTEFVKAKRTKQPSEADKAAWQAAGLPITQVYGEVDVEVSESQVQKLRSGQRVDGALRVAALLFAVLLAAHGFFRLDAWTKGYLTGWLGVGAAVLVAAALLLVLA